MCLLDLVMTLSVKILYFLGLVLLLIVHLHHFGLFNLFISGLSSYKTSVPTGNLGNSLPRAGLLALSLTFSQAHPQWIFCVHLSWES